MPFWQGACLVLGGLSALCIVLWRFASLVEAAIRGRLLNPETGILETLRDNLVEPALRAFEDRVINPIRSEMEEMKLDAARVSTIVEMSKALSAKRGLAGQNSAYRINLERLAEMIEAANYIAEPSMVEAFRRIVEDPETPTESIDGDGRLWGMIEREFGYQALAEEVMKFGAEPGEAPGLWIMCIREAQRIGADALLRKIKVIR